MSVERMTTTAVYLNNVARYIGSTMQNNDRRLCVVWRHIISINIILMPHNAKRQGQAYRLLLNDHTNAHAHAHTPQCIYAACTMEHAHKVRHDQCKQSPC